MTDNEINQAIAKACGWIKTYDEGCGLWYWHRGKRKVRRPPDYCRDLNAMHEAEHLLFGRNDWSACKYEEQLKRLTSWPIFATARQRAETFRRTIGK